MDCISFNRHFPPSLWKYKIFIRRILRYLFEIFKFKILSLSLYVMLKLSETTSPQILFPSDCITLYIFVKITSIFIMSSQTPPLFLIDRLISVYFVRYCYGTSVRPLVQCVFFIDSIYRTNNSVAVSQIFLSQCTQYTYTYTLLPPMLKIPTYN